MDPSKHLDAFQGELVRLRAVRESDWERYLADSESDSEAARLHSQIEIVSGEAVRTWLREKAAQTQGDERTWAIETLDGELVGSINTGRCDARNGTFSYGLGIFREYWRRGYGRDAIRILLRVFFQELGYQKVNVAVYAFNAASQELHAQLGFSLEGQQRRMVYSGGRHHDELLYGLTAEEFREREGL